MSWCFSASISVTQPGFQYLQLFTEPDVRMQIQCQWCANDARKVQLLCNSGGTFALFNIYLHYSQTYELTVLVTCNWAGEMYADVKEQRQRLRDSNGTCSWNNYLSNLSSWDFDKWWYAPSIRLPIVWSITTALLAVEVIGVERVRDT